MPRTLNCAVCLIMILFASVTQAHAQDSQRFEAFGSLGTSWYDSSSGQSFNFGGGVGWRPFGQSTRLLDGMGIELELNHSFKRELVFSRTIGTADFLYRFNVRRTEPYVLVGFGFSRTPAICTHVCGTPEEHWVQTAGAGVNIFLREHWALRPEIRAFKGQLADYLGNHDYLGRASIALSYHW